MFSDEDIRSAKITYASFGSQYPDSDQIIHVAEKTAQGVYLTKIPHHIHRYLMDNKKQITFPPIFKFIHSDGSFTIVDKPQEFLRAIREKDILIPIPTERSRPPVDTNNNNDNEQDSGIDDEDDEDTGETQNQDNDRKTNLNDNKWKTTPDLTDDKATRYHTGASSSRRDKYTDHHHEIALSEASDYRNRQEKKADFISSRTNQEARDDHKQRVRDLNKQSPDVYSHCTQCSSHPRHRLRLEYHKHALVRVLVLHQKYAIRKPIELLSFYTPTVTHETNDDIRAQNWALYGREAYWQDSGFYQNMIIQAEKILRHQFPLETFTQLKVDMDLEPICITYATPFETMYVTPVSTLNQRMHDAPEPLHIIDNPYDRRPGGDAEFVLSFILTTDTKPAIDLQIHASEDELVQRLKGLKIRDYHPPLMGLGKLILAYAAFQERKTDGQYEQS